MVNLARNVPSEARLQCPICEKTYKIRTTKKHVKEAHGMSITYTCVFPADGGGVCGFSCGKRISCFINHQTRRHKLNFMEMSDHKYDITTCFLLEIVGGGEDLHTPTCTEETKFFSAKTMKEVRKRYKDKVGSNKTVVDVQRVDEPEPEVEKNSKRKAESDIPAKDVKKAKKETLVKNTHTESALPQSDYVDGSVPSGVSDDDIEVIDISDDDDDEEEAPANDIPEPTQENEAPANDVPETEQTEMDDEFWEQYYAQQNFVSDSEDEEILEPELRFKAGGGKFSRDLDVLIKVVSDEMEETYLRLRDDYPAWKKVINKLMLCWHPDKNPVIFKRKSEEVMKMITKERKRLESGEKS